MGRRRFGLLRALNGTETSWEEPEGGTAQADVVRRPAFAQVSEGESKLEGEASSGDRKVTGEGKVLVEDPVGDERRGGSGNPIGRYTTPHTVARPWRSEEQTTSWEAASALDAGALAKVVRLRGGCFAEKATLRACTVR